LGDNHAQSEWRDAIERDYQFEVVDTCATDGLCQIACPVGIDTGQFVKHQRSSTVSDTARTVADSLAESPVVAERSLRFGLRTAQAVANRWGPDPLIRTTALLRRAVPAVPTWQRTIPSPPRSAPSAMDAPSPDVVYFPSYLSRMMGQPSTVPNAIPVGEAFISLAHSAGLWMEP